jgi:hypothetical protein
LIWAFFKSFIPFVVASVPVTVSPLLFLFSPSSLNSILFSSLS